LNGRLDFIWRISKDAHQQLLRDGAPIQLIKSPSLRIAFLVMNRAGRNNENSPLRDVRIRRAIAHAIDRDEIAHKVFGSRLNVIQALCHPAQVGCIQDVRVYEYSPETARELLEGSVYEGSSIIGPPIIIKWRNRIVDALDMWTKYFPGEPDDALEIRSYRNHSASLDIASYLKTVGVDAYVKEFSSFQTALANVQAGKVDLAHVTWASHGSFDLADLMNPLFRGGLLDYCNDVKINRWLNVAADTNDQKVRNHAYRNILVRLQDTACVLPLFSYTTFYAFSKQLDLMPALDDVPRFYSARWK
jgi:peptide/nickel transport system substrate-binding protein